MGLEQGPHQGQSKQRVKDLSGPQTEPEPGQAQAVDPSAEPQTRQSQAKDEPGPQGGPDHRQSQEPGQGRAQSKKTVGKSRTNKLKNMVEKNSGEQRVDTHG